MKNLFSLCLMAVAAVMVSCGGNANRNNNAVEEPEISIVEEVATEEACCGDEECTGECCEKVEEVAENA